MTGKSFFVQWVVAVTVAMLLATMGAFAAMWSIGEAVQRAWGDVASWLVVGAIFGSVIGLGVGLGQGVVLRAQGIPFGRWLGRTVLAGAVGVMIVLALTAILTDFENVPDFVTALLMAVSLGLPIGWVQAPMLRPVVAQPSLWTPICLVAFLIAFAVGLPLGGEGREWLSVGVVALLTALLTGAGILWLRREGEAALATTQA